MAELAAKQHGVVARRQLVAAGFGRGAIDHRLRAGRLHPVHAGVYADGFAFHRTRAAFEADRARDADLQLAGYRVLRLTSRRLAAQPQAVARAIEALLAPPEQAPPP